MVFATLPEHMFLFDPPMLHNRRPAGDGDFTGGSHPYGVSLAGLATLRAALRSPYAPLQRIGRLAGFCLLWCSMDPVFDLC